ncbi:hypothetical protein V5799_032365 [Amblyomma americanum]|uniref:Homeobox domain-containing protein n=1 Tax=Amblyomma americanum TaxID=6943 RepID=A0AAQ4DRD6_AMBAM
MSTWSWGLSDDTGNADTMFSKEELVYATSPRVNPMASSKTSFLIRDILGASSTSAATTHNALFDGATSSAGAASTDPATAAATAAGIAALVALRGAAPGWTSTVGSTEPQAEPPACCGGFLLGCVTVPCLGCATSSWNAAGYPDLSAAYLSAGGAASPWASSAFPLSPAVSSVEALAGPPAPPPSQQQHGSSGALSLSPSAAGGDSLSLQEGRELRRARRNRTVFTEGQLMGLERRFDSQKYLSTPDRADLARVLGLTQLQVKTWYQNRRMKWKKQGDNLTAVSLSSVPRLRMTPLGIYYAVQVDHQLSVLGITCPWTPIRYVHCWLNKCILND